VPAAAPWLVRWIRAGRIDRVHASSAALRALHAPSLDRYAELLGVHADGLIETTGQIYVWRSSSASPTEALARSLREQHGVVTRALDANEIREMDPNLADGFTRGLFFPDNGHTVNPLRLVRTLVNLFGEAGGKVERRKVARFEFGDGNASAVHCEDATRIQPTASSSLRGFARAHFASALGDRIPLEAERGYHVMLPNPGVRPRIKISNRDHMFGLTPMEHGVRISGPSSSRGPTLRWTSAARARSLRTPSECIPRSTARARSSGWAAGHRHRTACPWSAARRARATSYMPSVMATPGSPARR
jgi:D-amino-acid dehydrogenase